MTATQAPTPGPLSGDDVKLLVKGDLLRVLKVGPGMDDSNLCVGQIVTVRSLDFEGDPILEHESPSETLGWSNTHYAFIGRPDADSWVKCRFASVPDYLRGIQVEAKTYNDLIRKPQKAENVAWPNMIAFRLAPTAPVEASGSELHPATADLVDRFAAELKSKLAKAEAKYGYAADWLNTDWQDELNESLAEHIQKGDPRDVAAYCAFAWHHGWSTSDALGHFAPKLHFQSSRERIAKCIRRAVGDAWIGECQAEVAADAVLNLRPQPSGETR